MTDYVIGVDIGGTKIAAHSCDRDYNTQFEITVPCPARQGGKMIIEAVITCIEQLKQQTDGNLIAIGVGAAGQINPKSGVVIDANDNLTDWVGTPIAKILADKFDVLVAVENDVRTMALAEVTLGSGQGYQHVLCITIGTGIGGAIVLNGQVWHGAHFSAGEIGYLFAGKNITIEETASGIAMEEEYHFHRAFSLREIAQRANQGEQKARRVLRQGSEILADVLAPVLVFLDPQALIVGGGVPEAGHWWWKYFLKTLADYPLKSVQQIDVLQANLGSQAGKVGAAILAWQKVDTL